jgi:hypothetical protein
METSKTRQRDRKTHGARTVRRSRFSRHAVVSNGCWHMPFTGYVALLAIHSKRLLRHYFLRAISRSQIKIANSNYAQKCSTLWHCKYTRVM